jgi:hypothetical protein
VQTSRDEENQEMEEYCLVIFGNRSDLMPSSIGSAVSEWVGLGFFDELVSLSRSLSSNLATPEDEGDWLPSQRAWMRHRTLQRMLRI